MNLVLYKGLGFVLFSTLVCVNVLANRFDFASVFLFHHLPLLLPIIYFHFTPVPQALGFTSGGRYVSDKTVSFQQILVNSKLPSTIAKVTMTGLASSVKSATNTTVKVKVGRCSNNTRVFSGLF